MRVRCKLPNASELISGVTFQPDESGHMVSEEIDEATASRFCSIKGYELAEDDAEAARVRAEAVAAEATRLKAEEDAKAEAKRISQEEAAAAEAKAADAVHHAKPAKAGKAAAATNQ